MIEAHLPPEIPIRNFDAAKQTALFQTLKKPQFTGRLVLKNLRSQQWSFFLYFGRLVYATGRTHGVRRWRRYLTAHMPHIAANTQLLQQSLATLNGNAIDLHWEYHLIQAWHLQQRITREQIRRTVEAIATEIFFEVSQSTQITYEFKPILDAKEPMIVMDPAQSILQAWRLFEQWNTLDISHLSPQLAPVIVKPELLQARSSETNYRLLTNLVTGRRTFWDLSIRLKQDVSQAARLLMPYMKLGFVDVQVLEDLPAPIPLKADIPQVQVLQTTPDTSPTIAYMSLDSTQHQQLQGIFAEHNYRYLAIADPAKALSTLLLEKPDLILLDFELDGGINGLDFCTQLKKLTLFRQTPILILADNQRLLDRVKGRLSGATDFINKTNDSQELIQSLDKYLR